MEKLPVEIKNGMRKYIKKVEAQEKESDKLVDLFIKYGLTRSQAYLFWGAEMADILPEDLQCSYMYLINQFYNDKESIEELFTLTEKLFLYFDKLNKEIRPRTKEEWNDVFLGYR